MSLRNYHRYLQGSKQSRRRLWRPATSRQRPEKKKAHPHVFTQFDPGPVDRGHHRICTGLQIQIFWEIKFGLYVPEVGHPGRETAGTCLSGADGKAASRPAECKPRADLERLEANQRRRGDV